MSTVDPVEPNKANQSLIIRGTRRIIDLNKLCEDNNEKEVNNSKPNKGNAEENPKHDGSEKHVNNGDDDYNGDDNNNENNDAGSEDAPNIV